MSELLSNSYHHTHPMVSTCILSSHQSLGSHDPAHQSCDQLRVASPQVRGVRVTGTGPEEASELHTPLLYRAPSPGLWGTLHSTPGGFKHVLITVNSNNKAVINNN